jgi:hypothetical protein
MEFLKNLFGGLLGGGRSGDSGVYVYIRLDRSGEIIRLRINPGNEISRDDNEQLFVRKLVTGSRSFERAEATIYFDSSYRVKNADISGGELSSEKEYRAQQEQAS